MTENGSTTTAPANPQLTSPQSKPNCVPDSSSLRDVCTKVHNLVSTFLAQEFEDTVLQNTQHQCRHTLSIIHEAIDRYPYPTLSLSYNGGKDCLVLLLLYLSALATHPSADHAPPTALPSIYIPPPHPFPAQDAFVSSSSTHYHLALSQHAHPSMKTAFAHYLSSPAGSAIKAIFVGTRRTDPHGANLTPFDVTDGGWPEFMRVHPVLEWRYKEVWAFLREVGGVKWCRLYDEGFTSLGGREDTRPNPYLAVLGGGGKVVGYRPAWELEEEWEERGGRE